MVTPTVSESSVKACDASPVKTLSVSGLDSWSSAAAPSLSCTECPRGPGLVTHLWFAAFSVLLGSMMIFAISLGSPDAAFALPGILVFFLIGNIAFKVARLGRMVKGHEHGFAVDAQYLYVCTISVKEDYLDQLVRNSRYQVVGLVVGGCGLLAIAVSSRFFYGDRWKWGAGVYGTVAVACLYGAYTSWRVSEWLLTYGEMVKVVRRIEQARHKAADSKADEEENGGPAAAAAEEHKEVEEQRMVELTDAAPWHPQETT